MSSRMKIKQGQVYFQDEVSGVWYTEQLFEMLFPKQYSKMCLPA